MADESPHLKNAAPILNVADVRAAAEYYRDKLGFTIEGIGEGADVHYAIVIQGGARIHFRCHTGNPSPQRGATYIMTKNLDALYARCRENGVSLNGEPVTHPYGMRELSFHDPDGNQLIFGEAVGEVAFGTVENFGE